MEYVPRGSLRPYMKRLTLAQIAGVLEGVLAGLAHAERAESSTATSAGEHHGHRRRTREDHRLRDRARDQRAGTQYMTATGMTVGTPTYMAPEQAMAGDIGPWSDLYSVGVLTYELLVGHVPFHDTDAPMVILMRHVNERIPSAVEVRPDVDPRLSSGSTRSWSRTRSIACGTRWTRGRPGGHHRRAAGSAVATRRAPAGRPDRGQQRGAADPGAVREPGIDPDADAGFQPGRGR